MSELMSRPAAPEPGFANGKARKKPVKPAYYAGDKFAETVGVRWRKAFCGWIVTVSLTSDQGVKNGSNRNSTEESALSRN